jgi:hypothetical protein
MNNICPINSRKIVTLLMTLTLCWTTFACSGPSAQQSQDQPTQNQDQQSTNVSTAQTQLADGQYPVQQATYDDANGEYSLFLLNTPPDTPSLFRTGDLQMAALTDAEVSSGQKAYLKIEGGKASMHIPQDFKIEYVHNVTETQTNPQTGQPQTVVVGQQSSFWTPFAGALAGQAIGSLLFRPQYYVPPIYRPGGGPLTGFGGYGSSYGQAAQRYQNRYQAPPIAVRNRQAGLRTSGGLRSPTSSTVRRSPSSSGSRSSGSGFGSSNLRQSERSSPSQFRRGSGSFGSGRRSTGFGSRSFGRRR